MIKFAFYVIFTFFSISLMAATNSIPLVLNGVNVTKENAGWKYTAQLSGSSQDGSIKNCTGVLIEKNVVLTAAHCLVNVSGVRVRLNEPLSKSAEEASGYFTTTQTQFDIHPDYIADPIKKPSTREQYQAAQQTSHESDSPFVDAEGNIGFLKESYEKFKIDYFKDILEERTKLFSFKGSVSERKTPDIGIIVLAEEVPAPFEPLKLFEGQPANDLSFGRELISYGFGYSKLNIYSSDGLLRWTDLHLVGSIENESTDTHIVGFAMNRFGLISGDSGGPTVVEIEGEDYLVGINAAIGHDGHAVLVIPQTYQDWISLTQSELLGVSQLN